jgi:hypothetical protein
VGGIARERTADPLRGQGPLLRRGDGRPAVAITPPTVDGGTRVELAAQPVGAVASLVRRLRESGKAGEQVELPLADGSAAWGRLLTTRAVGGGFAILVEGLVHVTIGGHFVRLEFKAQGLWSRGWSAVAGQWIEAASAWVGRPCTLADSHALGWRVTALELCRDLQGLGAWSLDDARPLAWVGWRAAGVTAHANRSGATIGVGTRYASNVSICCYGKRSRGEIVSSRGDASDASYVAAWSSSAAYSPERDVQRVEYRLRKRGLDLACMRSGEVGMLRDPAALADSALLGRVWAYLTARYRLVVPEAREGSGAVPNDPRWLVVARVPESSDDAARDFAQLRAENRASLAEQQQRSRQRLIAALARDAGLHGARPASEAAAVAWATYRLAGSHPAEIVKLAKRAETVTRERMAVDGWALAQSAADAREAIGVVPGLAWTTGMDREHRPRPLFGPGPWSPPDLPELGLGGLEHFASEGLGLGGLEHFASEGLVMALGLGLAAAGGAA